MASGIEDATSLPGETVSDQDGLKIGKVKRLYAVGDDEAVMWVTIETSIGVGNQREVFVPLARIKHEQGELRVPYSVQHIQSAPEVEPGEELSEGDDQALRGFYSIDLADRELRTDNDSYANQVPEGDGPARLMSS
jgi:PRC-barrel domain